MTGSAQSALKPVWELMQKCIAENRLVTIHFVNVFEYLAYLEAAAAVMKVPPTDRPSMFSISCWNADPGLTC